MAHLIVWTIIDGLFILYIVFTVSECKSGRKIGGILFWSITGMAGTIVMQTCLDNGWQIAGVISAGQAARYVQIIVVFLFGSMFLRGGITRTVLSVAISDLLATAAELSEQVVYYLIMHRSMGGFYLADMTENSFLQGILLFGCNFVICLLLHKEFRKIRTIPFERSWVSKVLACVYIFLGFSPSSKMLFTIEDSKKDFLFFILCIACLFIGFVVLSFSERNRIYQQKNMHLFLQEQMIKEHVRLMEDQIMLTRRFRHDIRKHFDMVSYFLDKNPEYADSQQLSEYKRDLCGMYHSLSRGDYCDMMDVNAILYQLEQFCKKNRVSFAAKLKNMVCKDMKPEKRCDIFFGAVNWAMEICKDYEEKEKLSVELSGETTAGRSIFAVTVKLKKSADEINSHSNLCVSSQSIWQERLEKSLASCDGFWKTEKEPGMCRLVVSWAENT